MGSVVITSNEVANRSFPHHTTMFGVVAHPHHQPHESQRSRLERNSPHSSHTADAPIADVAPHHSNTSQAPAQPAPASVHPPSPLVSSSSPASPQRIKVKSLSNIRSVAADEGCCACRARERNGRATLQYKISEMPIADIIEMVAGLLTDITTPPPQSEDTNPGLGQPATSILAFHGKNIPAITIMSYLNRIHKYCPTTYEVFLSLLVYIDRMTENKIKRFLLGEGDESLVDDGGSQSRSITMSGTTIPPTSPCPKQVQAAAPRETTAREHDPPSPPQRTRPSQLLAVDNFNIHRLIIAGVTCASKFFSDIFYTNSRYAKVGGLPLVELNHLELQFLLLNDFRLAVKPEEIEDYGTLLVTFYGRKFVA